MFWSNGLVGTIMALGLIALFWPMISDGLDARRGSPRPPEPSDLNAKAPIKLL